MSWGQVTMVKRRKEEEIAGVLEFEGRTSEDAELLEWLVDHRARDGGRIRVGLGVRGVRVMFGDEADMALWKARSEQATKGKRPPAS